ncbi:hypothetical protein VTK73DRAFT_3613 [Phialemonium thermophilum]|uniref:Protein YIF1 n=1 Tax=Phialemonium thermophilum TaxID=223376 RepID=A0ABR3WYN1_9PEZI
MQRPVYNQSPPLHHPVPQHVSTVPQLRSPPPPMPPPQSQGGYGSPYPQQQTPGSAAANHLFGQYGNFMNDPAAQIATQFGQTAFKHGQEYLEQNVNRFVNISALKHYFNVSNSYVVNKIFLVLFPWRHKPWSRKQVVGPNGQDGWYLPPRDDINSPDMYIPVMSLVTYILLSTLIAGLRGQFQPELFGYTASKALVVVLVEILGLKLGCYFLSISNESQLLDLVAYSGYKFVGIIATTSVAAIVNGGAGTGGWLSWLVFFYTFFANSLFLMRSLRYVLFPSSAVDNRGPMQPAMQPAESWAKRNQKNQFLFFYAYIVQLIFMLILSRA